MYSLSPLSHPLALYGGYVLGPKFSSLFYIVPQRGSGDGAEHIALAMHLGAAVLLSPDPYEASTGPSSQRSSRETEGRRKRIPRSPWVSSERYRGDLTRSQSKMKDGDQHGQSCVLHVRTRDRKCPYSSTRKRELTHKMPQHLSLTYTVPRMLESPLGDFC